MNEPISFRRRDVLIIHTLIWRANPVVVKLFLIRSAFWISFEHIKAPRWGLQRDSWEYSGAGNAGSGGGVVRRAQTNGQSQRNPPFDQGQIAADQPQDGFDN